MAQAFLDVAKVLPQLLPNVVKNTYTNRKALRPIIEKTTGRRVVGILLVTLLGIQNPVAARYGLYAERSGLCHQTTYFGRPRNRLTPGHLVKSSQAIRTLFTARFGRVKCSSARTASDRPDSGPICHSHPTVCRRERRAN